MRSVVSWLGVPVVNADFVLFSGVVVDVCEWPRVALCEWLVMVWRCVVGVLLCVVAAAVFLMVLLFLIVVIVVAV